MALFELPGSVDLLPEAPQGLFIVDQGSGRYGTQGYDPASLAGLGGSARMPLKPGYLILSLSSSTRCSQGQSRQALEAN